MSLGSRPIASCSRALIELSPDQVTLLHYIVVARQFNYSTAAIVLCVYHLISASYAPVHRHQPINALRQQTKTALHYSQHKLIPIPLLTTTTAKKMYSSFALPSSLIPTILVLCKLAEHVAESSTCVLLLAAWLPNNSCTLTCVPVSIDTVICSTLFTTWFLSTVNLRNGSALDFAIFNNVLTWMVHRFGTLQSKVN